MPYKLSAVPGLLPDGEFKGHLEIVTFVAKSDEGTHEWWAVNIGTFEKDFNVSPELAENIVVRLRLGEVVDSPNQYELDEVKGQFGGRWSD